MQYFFDTWISIISPSPKSKLIYFSSLYSVNIFNLPSLNLHTKKSPQAISITPSIASFREIMEVFATGYSPLLV